MKKHTAGLALAAVTGFTVLTATPAFADGPGGDGMPQPPSTPYANCSEAAAEGVYNIPSNHPRYGTHLDRDMDGYGCDDDTKPVTQWPVTQPDGSTTPQVGRVPAGGADTGITQEPQGSSAGVLALGGLVLATAAGGTFVVRRRNTQQV